MSGETGASGLDVVGMEGQNCALLRRELYLVCWSAVRAGRVAGVDDGIGWMKGVLTGVVEPSTVALSAKDSLSEGTEMDGIRDAVVCAGSGACPFAIFSFPRALPFTTACWAAGVDEMSGWLLSAIIGSKVFAGSSIDVVTACLKIGS